MSKRITIIISTYFIITTLVFPQGSGFFNVYSDFYDCELKQAFPTQDGAILFATPWLEKNRYGFIKISEMGEVIDSLFLKSSIDFSYFFSTNSLCTNIHDENFGVVYSKVDNNTQTKANIYFDLIDLERKERTASIQITNDTTFYTPRDIIKNDTSILILADNAFQRIENNTIYVDSTKVFLIRIDLDGNVMNQFELTYTNKYNYVNSFIETDSFFFIASNTSERSYNSDNYNLKGFDKDLNLLWEADRPITRLASSPPILTKFTDSIFLMGGSAHFDNGMVLHSGDAKIEFFDFTGRTINELWRERTLTQFLLKSLIEISNDQFLGCGLDDNALQDLGGTGAPRIFKSNIEGENIWDHTYWDGNLNLSHSYLNNVVELSDGQILGVGTYLDFENHSGSSPSKGLVILTDSLGCIQGDCDDLIITSVESLENNDQPSINIFPNPALDVLKIKSHNKLKSIQLIDFYGSIQYQYSNLMGLKSFELDLKEFSKGIYFVKLETSDLKVYFRKIFISN